MNHSHARAELALMDQALRAYMARKAEESRKARAARRAQQVTP